MFYLFFAPVYFWKARHRRCFHCTTVIVTAVVAFIVLFRLSFVFNYSTQLASLSRPSKPLLCTPLLCLAYFSRTIPIQSIPGVQ